MSWTYINKSDIDSFLMEYPKLQEFWHMLTLLETQNAIFLPRLMRKNFPSQYLQEHISQKEITFQTTKVEFTKTLRPRQQEAFDIVKNQFNKNGFCNGILKLFPGAGKTVLTVALSALTKKKTLIIIDNDELLKQWVKAYLDFSNVTMDDIGIIKQKNFCTHKPITIATVQTLLSKVKNGLNKAYAEIDKAGFDLIVYDEVHATSSSENFARASLLFRSLNIIGLSATPFQIGGQEILMKNTIGEILYETNDYELVPKYYFCFYDSELGEKYGKRINRIPDFIQKKAIYNNVILNSTQYIDKIQKYATNLAKNKYTTMIVCITKKQVKAISDELERRGVPNRRFYGDEREIDKINDDIVVTTYQFTGRGFDMPRLSALILACPLSGKKSVIQVVGRILRSHENKLEPLVIDLIDLSFPLLFMPEVKRKIGILKNEFKNCKIFEYKE